MQHVAILQSVLPIWLPTLVVQNGSNIFENVVNLLKALALLRTVVAWLGMLVAVLRMLTFVENGGNRRKRKN